MDAIDTTEIGKTLCEKLNLDAEYYNVEMHMPLSLWSWQFKRYEKISSMLQKL